MTGKVPPILVLRCIYILSANIVTNLSCCTNSIGANTWSKMTKVRVRLDGRRSWPYNPPHTRTRFRLKIIFFFLFLGWVVYTEEISSTITHIPSCTGFSTPTVTSHTQSKIVIIWKSFWSGNFRLVLYLPARGVPFSLNPILAAGGRDISHCSSGLGRWHGLPCCLNNVPGIRDKIHFCFRLFYHVPVDTCTLKNVSDFPVPSRDVANRTNLNYSRPGRVWLVTSRLGTGKSETFLYSVWTIVKIIFSNTYQISQERKTLSQVLLSLKNFKFF